MLPRDLTAASFGSYPPQARRVAASQVALLRELPLSFVPLLLRELIAYDWKFPAERKELEQQFSYLEAQTVEARRLLMAGFAKLHISRELERSDWVDRPLRFSEDLSTELWATRQIDAFRVAATDYMHRVHAAAPQEPLPVPRLGLVALGQGAAQSNYRLFRKLRRYGVHYRNVQPAKGVRMMLDFVSARAKAHPVPYGHWYVDGGSAESVPAAGLTCVSYSGLATVRTTLEDKMRRAYSSGMGPEAFRSMLARLSPKDLGDHTDDPIMSRFQVSLLTEGSGTQIFSTTFVEWAAREALRRAGPVTLLLRFVPRQRFRPMNELLAEDDRVPELDPQGSLVDADMGAYYTWLNQQRLEGAQQAAFLAWYEDHNEAVAVAPSLTPNTESNAPVDIDHLLTRLS